MYNRFSKLVQLLESVRDGIVDCERAEDEAEKLDWDSMPEISNVYGNLFHFWNDTDLRKTDKKYNDWQSAELVKLIDHLKTGDYQKATNISFLHVS